MCPCLLPDVSAIRLKPKNTKHWKIPAGSQSMNGFHHFVMGEMNRKNTRTSKEILPHYKERYP
jgi:hypothetical protein